MVKKHFPDDMSLSSSFCAVAAERVERGQSFLRRAQKYHPELREHEVKDTTADGMCFLHAIVLQVELEKQYSVWDIAVSLLHWMSCRKPEWAAYVDDENIEERVENLRVHGVMREIERRSTCIHACDYNAYLYLLDRCAGIVDRDWGYPRLYCDGLFLQEFAKWLGSPILILRCKGEGKVDILESFTQSAEDPFVFKIAHYSDQPEHFNAICGRSEMRQSPERIWDRIRRNIMESRAHHAWQVYNFDVLLVALEILPPLIEASESSEPSSSVEERSHDGNGGVGAKAEANNKRRERDGTLDPAEHAIGSFATSSCCTGKTFHQFGNGVASVGNSA